MSQGKVPKTSKELQNAIYDDFKRKVVDDAKKRAVAQHVDYDTFKNMVSVAHLRPLHAPSIVSQSDKGMVPAWEFAADGTRQSSVAQKSLAGSSLASSVPETAPSTSGDFEREWRRSCKTDYDKYKYLRVCGPDVLRSIFKVEVGADILGGIMQALDSAWLSFAAFAEDEEQGSALSEADFVLSILDALAESGRFSLTIRLQNTKVKAATAALFDNLGSAVGAAEGREGMCALLNQDQLERIKACYGLK